MIKIDDVTTSVPVFGGCLEERPAPLCLACCGLSELPLVPCRPFWTGLLPLLSCLDRVRASPRAPLYCLPGEVCSALCTAFKASGAEACGRLQNPLPSPLNPTS